jgi:hypothetical protein
VDGDKIADGILFEWLLTAALCISQLKDCSVKIADSVAGIGPVEMAIR